MLFAWNPLVVLESLQNGHNDVVAALPALLAVWLAFLGRIRPALVLLAVSLLVKPIAVALLPLLLVASLRRREAWPRLLQGLGLAGALVVLAYLPFWQGPDTLQGLARQELFSASPAALLLEALQATDLPEELALTVASFTAQSLFVLALLPLLYAVWRGRLWLPAAACGLYFFYGLIGAPWFNPWYLLWLAPLAALSPPGPQRQAALAFTLLAPLVYLLQYENLPIVLTIFLPLALLAYCRPPWRTAPEPASSRTPVSALR
jgi:alpha-1,6-mannosyltransferase